MVEIRTALAKYIANKLVRYFATHWEKSDSVGRDIRDKGPTYEGTSQENFWKDVADNLPTLPEDAEDAGNGSGKGQRRKNTVVAVDLVPQALQMDRLGRPITGHAVVVTKKEEKDEELPIKTWLKSEMCKEKPFHTARRALMSCINSVTHYMDISPSLRVVRGSHGIAVLAEEDIQRFQLVVPLFVRKSSSIVVEG